MAPPVRHAQSVGKSPSGSDSSTTWGIKPLRTPNLSRRWSLTSHTRASAPTNGYTKDTASQSTDGDRLGILLPYRTCSTNDRIRKTTCPLSGATSRTAGSGCAAVPTRPVSPPVQARDLRRPTIWNYSCSSCASSATSGRDSVATAKPASARNLATPGWWACPTMTSTLVADPSEPMIF